MWKLRKLWVLLLALLTFSATLIPAFAQEERGQCRPSFSASTHNGCETAIQVSARQLYYTIEGTTAPQLVSQIRQRGPLWNDGNRYEAMHTWKMNRSLGITQVDDRCILASPQIEVETDITLPQWEPPLDATIDLMLNWNKYTAALEKHEDGHQAIVLEAGTEALQRLNTFPSYASCADLKTDAEAAVDKILDGYNQKQIKYDRKTQHGLKQGASYAVWLMPSDSSPNRGF